jgi:hypothetical protein
MYSPNAVFTFTSDTAKQKIEMPEIYQSLNGM